MIPNSFQDSEETKRTHECQNMFVYQLLAKGEIFKEAEPGDICVLNGGDPLVTSLPVPRCVRKVSRVTLWSENGL